MRSALEAGAGTLGEVLRQRPVEITARMLSLSGGPHSAVADPGQAAVTPVPDADGTYDVVPAG